MAKLGEFAYVKNGYAFKSKDYIAADDNTVPVVRISDIQNDKADIVKAAHVHKDNTQQDFSIEIDDLLIAMSGATTGKTGVYKSKLIAYQNQRVGNIKLHSKLLGSNSYKNYLIASLSDEILKKAYGAAQPNISGKAIEEILVAIAPLNEQIRIANKLDSILAKVDAAQARFDKIPNILKRFRQSVLAAATSGELTKEWRGENKIPFKKNWNERAIKDITLRAFDGPFGSKLKTADYTLEGVKVVRLENIGHLKFLSHKETFVSEEKFIELEKHKLEHNDVLFSSFVDEDIRVCLFDAKHGTYINKADCFCLRPDESKVVPAFLSYFLASRKTYEEAKKQVHGATRPRINLKFLKSLTLYIPSLTEQKEVVRRIELLFADVDKIEKKYLKVKDSTNRLTQSILAKAFRGELVPQDENDEPAEVLLAKIKGISDAAIANNKTASKTKKKTKAA